MRIFGEDPNSALVASIADGAGSAKHSDEGAAIACGTVVDLASAHFECERSFRSFGLTEARQWYDAARERIGSAADAKPCEIREFATTLCTAIISPNRSIFFQVGDGAIIVSSNSVYGVVFWPQSGEYANSTNFLTAEAYEEHLDFFAIDTMCSSLAMITDGLERLALSFKTQTPHPPFFRPLFGALHDTDNPAGLSEELHRFLCSKSVLARSDDDKTLVLASYGRQESPDFD